MNWDHARWIKIPAEEYQDRKVYARDDGGRFAYFRCEAVLPEKCSLRALVSASSRYRLFINGKAVLSGPLKGDRFRQYYEEIDLTEYLTAGRNVFAAQVLYSDPYLAEEQTARRKRCFTGRLRSST